MITWIIYLLVAIILFFVIYLAFQGINRGIVAKNKNKTQLLAKEKNITRELKKLNDLYKQGALNKKQFEVAKKKILS